ncbi:MAG TPA: type II toxin-antitoxin system VapC family toxin [Terracidiphilus sp.]
MDSSALVSAIKREPDWIELSRVMDSAKTLSISAASYLETAVVIDCLRSPAQSVRLDELIDEMGMVIEPVTVEQARIARQAYRDYGKSSGHPASLNFGDCFSYALAREKREPLLYKGDDFGHTDLRSALQ